MKFPFFDKEYPLDQIVGAGNYSIYTTGTALFMPKLLQSVLSSKDKVIKNISHNGVLVKTLPELFSFLESRGGRQVVEKVLGDWVYVWDDYSFIDIDYNKKNNNISISGMGVNNTLRDLAPHLERDFISKVKKNLIFSIVRNSSGGLDIRNMGDGSSPLIKENYLPEVIEDIEYVISSFAKSPPIGRICVLNGEPGTGKTHLVRSMLMRLDCVFLIVPSNLIDSLDKPEFMPLLLSVKNEHEKPIIMIIEDGDVCLVPRKNDNISTIASLLNLSDGILGSIIDIKMVISTNADIKDMDQAIMRPGRLCKNIHVGPLPYEQANQVYRRLMKSEDVKLEYKKLYTLAEIYDITNNAGNTSHSYNAGQNRRVIGFSSSREDAVMNKKIGF